MQRDGGDNIDALVSVICRLGRENLQCALLSSECSLDFRVRMRKQEVDKYYL